VAIHVHDHEGTRLRWLDPVCANCLNCNWPDETGGQCRLTSAAVEHHDTCDGYAREIPDPSQERGMRIEINNAQSHPALVIIDSDNIIVAKVYACVDGTCISCKKGDFQIPTGPRLMGEMEQPPQTDGFLLWEGNAATAALNEKTRVTERKKTMETEVISRSRCIKIGGRHVDVDVRSNGVFYVHNVDGMIGRGTVRESASKPTEITWDIGKDCFTEQELEDVHSELVRTDDSFNERKGRAMPIYRKKPVEVDAHQWFKNGDHPEDGDPGSEGKVVRYYRDPYDDGQRKCKKCGNIMHDHGWIDTLEGGHIVCPGDWIITGVASEVYPVKPDIFAATYEPVS
jgi:hypothetical protein